MTTGLTPRLDAGLVTTGTQTIAGVKTFNDGLKLDDAAEQSTLHYYQEDDTTLANVTWGFSTPTSAFTIRITRVGRVVTLLANSTYDGTSSGSVAYVTLSSSKVLPLWARPSTFAAYPVRAVSGGSGQAAAGYLVVYSDGTISIYHGMQTGSTWPNSAGVGVIPFAVSYSV